MRLAGAFLCDTCAHQKVVKDGPQATQLICECETVPPTFKARQKTANEEAKR
jgi:hypothetical protein